MKAVLIIFVALALALLTITSELDAKQTTRQPTNGNILRCRRRVNNTCTPKGKVCVRFGRTNLCESYRNNCQSLLANCSRRGVSRYLYQRVNIRLCNGLAINQLLPCNSGTNSSSVN